MCLANDSCDNGSVRLVNGTTMSEGIVEVCLNGVWGNIISSGWNTPDAEVVCRQLGLSWECESYDQYLLFIKVISPEPLPNFSKLLAIFSSLVA